MRPSPAHPRPPRKARGGATLLVVLVIATLAGVAIDRGCQRFEAPWSAAADGRPTLTGSWEGPLHARLGAQFRLFMQLAYRSSPVDRAGQPGDNLEGSAWLCSQTGEIWEYEVSGVADRKAKDVQLRLMYPNPAWSALNLRMQGSFQGDRFAIHLHHNPFMPDGSFKLRRIVSSNDPDNSFVPAILEQKGRPAFDSACQSLR